MTCRTLLGQHPSTGEFGYWIARPGYDCITGDRTSRAQFFFSTNFADQKPFRIIKSGMASSNSNILLTASLAGLGGEPILWYRIMNNATQERKNGLYGVDNDGAGNAYSFSEFYSRFYDGSPAFFKIINAQSPTSTIFTLRYMVALV